MEVLDDLGRIVVLSPHFDDAVFSCGELVTAYPDCTVITVFSGVPARQDPLTQWDHGCGFENGAQAMQARHAENARALHELHAGSMQLDFLDSQYASRTAPDAVAARLAEIFLREPPDTVVFPLGLFHADHECTHDAAMLCRAALPGACWLAYEDALYRRKRGLLQQRLVRLHVAGISATPAVLVRKIDAARKARAIAAYASQLTSLGLSGGSGDPFLPERFWKLDPGVKEKANDG